MCSVRMQIRDAQRVLCENLPSEDCELGCRVGVQGADAELEFSVQAQGEYAQRDRQEIVQRDDAYQGCRSGRNVDCRP